MDERTVFLVGVAVVVFSIYYLEREMTREQLYWLFAGLGVLLGLAAAYISYTTLPYVDNQPYQDALTKFQYYVVFSVISMLMAVYYYPGKEEGFLVEEGPAEAKKKKRKKGRKAKN